MTSHLDDGRIAELLDGEIPSRELAAIQAHLAACPACAARLAAAEEMIAEADHLVTVLDQPVPVVPVLPITVGRPPRREWLRRAAWAASLVVAAGTGYLARVPRDGGPSGAADSALVAEAGERTAEAADTADHRVDAPVPAPAPGDAASASEPAPPLAAATRPPARPVVPASPPPAPARNEADERSAVAREQAVEPTLLPSAGARALATDRAGRPAALVPRDARLRVGNRDSIGAGRQGDLAASEAVATAKAGTDTISLAVAVRRLGGSLRLVDGLVPERVETDGTEVHVVYATPFGPVRLVQRRVDGRLVWHLVAPDGFPPDTLAAYRRRIAD